MAKELVKIGIAFEYDPAEHEGLPAHVFIFQMLNRLNYENRILSLRFKGRERTFDDTKPLKECEIRERPQVDGVPFIEN